MSFQTFMFKYMAAKGDKKRDSTLKVPDDIQLETNINYLGNNDKYNLLDVYFKKGTNETQPTIHLGQW